MPAIIANFGSLSWGGPYPGMFRPQGKLQYHGDTDQLFREIGHTNPASRSRKVSAGARIIVGFNVGKKPRWTMADLVSVVRKVRIRQVGQPDATFVAQTGMYTHQGLTAKKGVVVTEKGGQVLIKNLPHLKTGEAEFKAQMIELAEEICRALKQEIVIVDYQERGLSVEEWVVSP